MKDKKKVIKMNRNTRSDVAIDVDGASRKNNFKANDTQSEMDRRKSLGHVTRYAKKK